MYEFVCAKCTIQRRVWYFERGFSLWNVKLNSSSLRLYSVASKISCKMRCRFICNQFYGCCSLTNFFTVDKVYSTAIEDAHTHTIWRCVVQRISRYIQFWMTLKKIDKCRLDPESQQTYKWVQCDFLVSVLIPYYIVFGDFVCNYLHKNPNESS